MATRLTMLALTGATAATALAVAACGSSNTSSPATSPGSSPASSVASPTSSPPTAPPAGKQHVKGLIASVAGTVAQVNQKNGTAAVGFTNSTTITEVTPAALSDVTVGSCVTVRSKDGQTGPASAVRISAAANGKCPDGTGKHAPAAAGSVASVAGNTINITGSGGTQTAVTVGEKTRYTKQTPAGPQAISQGKCLTARGTADGSALQATSIDVSPARDGKCGGEGKPRR